MSIPTEWSSLCNECGRRFVWVGSLRPKCPRCLAHTDSTDYLVPDDCDQRVEAELIEAYKQKRAYLRKPQGGKSDKIRSAV